MSELPKEQKDQIKDKIKSFFLEEREQDIGDLAAEIILSFIEKEVAPFFYNRGVQDSKALMTKFFAVFDEELDYLEIIPGKTR